MQLAENNNQKMLQYIATSPIAVPENLELKKETSDKELGRYEKIANLSPKIRLALSHFSNPQKIQSIGKKYGFELLRLANITRLIREYYFGEVRLEDFPREIEKRMGVSLLTAQEIARHIKTEIIDWDPWAEFLATLLKMPVREILKNYPAIGDQEISSGYIELKGHAEVFDGTIHNWINDYILHLGQEKHGSIDRMNYLFHTDNTKNLSSLEREKLGIILKSFDENAPLPVDTQNNELVLEHLISNQKSAIQDQYRAAAPVSEKTFPPQISPQETFIRSYPRTETRETPPKEQLLESGPGSPLIVKNYVSRQNIPGAPQAPQKNIPPARPKVQFYEEPNPHDFIRRHPKNIIEPMSSPHYGEANRPDPKIEGNVVDLSMNNEQGTKNNSE